MKTKEKRMFHKVVVCLLIGAASPAMALNGRPYIDAPQQTFDTVIGAVGALVKKQGYDKEGKRSEEASDKEQYRVSAHAIFVGNNRSGSVILVSGLAVLKNDGEVNKKVLEDYRLRFGPTVSSRQVDRRVKREEYRIPANARVFKHPNYLSVNDRKLTKNKNKAIHDIVLIELPYQFKSSRRPIPIVQGRTGLTPKTLLTVFGHGNQYDEAIRKEVDAPEYELDQTSGYLRWIPMQFDSFWASQLYIKMVPASFKTLSQHFRSSGALEEDVVTGPCRFGDSAAPLLMEGSKLKKVNNVLQAVSSVALLGVHHASAGTCTRQGKEDSPRSAFIDLREKTYQDFLTSHVAGLVRP